MIIDAKNISVRINGFSILEDINLKINEGDKIAVVGESGCGKSILLRTLSGINTKFSGSLKIYEKSIGFLFQSCALFDSLTVKENILFNQNSLNVNIFDIIRKVNLNENDIGKYPSEISGGMRKRVALARLIAHPSKLIFLDEPTSGLDPYSAFLFSKSLHEHCLDKTSITITHDITNIHLVADKYILLKDKTIYSIGNVNEINTSKDLYVRQFFLLDK